MQENKTLTLTGSLEGSGTIRLRNNTTLDMGDAGTSLAINVSGSATLSNGALDNAVTVQQGAKLTMGEKVLSFSGTKFTLADGATANLKGNKIAGDFTLNGTAALTSGTLVVKSLDPAAQGLLQDMTARHLPKGAEHVVRQDEEPLFTPCRAGRIQDHLDGIGHVLD